jgi:hypothetical protein
MTPAALAKAESLAKFVQASGCARETFALTLTDAEAFELLDYLADGGLGRYENHDLLMADVAEAKRRGDPWKVLGCFQLAGLNLAPVSILH